MGAMAAQPQRRIPRKEVPTTIQIDTRPTVMMVRGLLHQCPACGGRHVFRHWFRMEKRCPTCDLLFERVEGHWIGSLGLNTTVVFAVMLLVLLGGSMLTFPNPPYEALLIAEISLAIIGPLLFFPSSRTMWTAMDLLMRPLRPGEIDPRFVKVDPERDRPPSRPSNDPRGRS